MRIDVITLFPELFSAHLVHGVTRRAFEPGRIDVHLWPLRDFGDPPHARVDDRPYGGGPGMVLLVEPLERALAAVRAARDEAAPAPVVSFSPAGTLLRQPTVEQLAAGPGAILLCGRYEGIDQRFIDAHVDRELSIGDYVLSGGEFAALVVIDAVVRRLPGTLGGADSLLEESHTDDLLEYPQYTRPSEFRGWKVPDILLSGNHGQIARWRRQQRVIRTARRRPDLIDKACLDEPERRLAAETARDDAAEHNEDN